jgi:hypothetical protein
MVTTAGVQRYNLELSQTSIYARYWYIKFTGKVATA